MVSGVLGLWLSQNYIAGVSFFGPLFIIPKAQVQLGSILNTLLFAGVILGSLNYFVKPLLKTITLPLRIITLNLFTLAVMMFLVWALDYFLPALKINGLKPLFFTAILVWAINFILTTWLPDKPKF